MIESLTPVQWIALFCCVLILIGFKVVYLIRSVVEELESLNKKFETLIKSTRGA